MLRGSCQKDSGISQTQHPCILEPEMQRNLRNSEGWNSGVFEPCAARMVGSCTELGIRSFTLQKCTDFLGLLDPLNPGILELVSGNGKLGRSKWGWLT